MKKWVVYLTFAFALVIVLSQINQGTAVAEPDTPLAPSAAPNWNSLGVISQSSGITSAVTPAIAASSNGSKVIVVYNGVIGGDLDNQDVFYTTSTNYGATWPTKARIHQSTGVTTNSTFVDVTMSPNNKGHAVWIEGFNSIPNLVYKNEDNWGSNSTNLVTISQVPLFSDTLTEPKIVAKNNSRLDVVWSEGTQTTDINIFHAYSTNGGSSFIGKVAVAQTNPSSRSPSIAVDAAGNYHVVWEELTNPSRVLYSRGVPSGNSVIWSVTPLNISVRSIPGNTTAARQPKIYADGNVLHVTYANYINKQEQYVHHLQCNSGCTSASNWQSVGNPISGQVLTAKASDPFDLISTIGQIGKCTFVYFHGIQGNSNDENNRERIWGTNSCGNWAASVRDQVTLADVRSINPVMVSANDWWLFMAYEQVNSDASLREIYFVRNKPALYLPMIRK